MSRLSANMIGLLAVPVLLAGELAVGCVVEGDAGTPAPAVAGSAAPDPPRRGTPSAKPVTAQPGVPTSVAGAGQDPAGVDPADPGFPPILVDIVEHRDGWWRNDCLRCHETGVQNAPEVVHTDMPRILLSAKCRSCHVFVPGSKPELQPAPATGPAFEPNAFPPMIPASRSHPQAWTRDDCLLCHDDGMRGAPKLVHEGMPQLLRRVKCRSCHVQVRVLEASERGFR